ncbi:MAG: SDR family NAD(P)-dependent oxidoreductase [Planctomycetota bacterium]|nr:SDR family NAD(P)-dependent oxidoreductase [Planctomycetota bacterium]
MEPRLAGKVALVTGGGRGIGRAISKALAAAGAHVVVTARTQGQIGAVAKEIADAGGAAAAMAMDLADESSVRPVFAAVRERFGRLDVLVNNAGIGLYGLVKDVPLEDLDRMVGVNLRGTFLCCQEAMRIMAPQKSGYIINISSVVGFKGYPKQAGYTATKHAVMGLTKSLAVEAQEHGIRTSAILPGGVDTAMVRDARPDLDPAILLQPEDVAQAVLYLLSLSDRAAVDEIYIRRRTSQPF